MIFGITMTVRSVVGFFFATMAGMMSYVAAQIILLSFFKYGAMTVTVSAILGGGVGGSIGGWLAWANLGAPRRENLMLLGLALAAGVIGAGLGVLRGTYVFHIEGTPGIPTLANLLWGAALGSTLAPLAYFLLRRAQGDRRFI